MVLAARHIVYQLAGHRYLGLGSLAQRYADGVAQSVGQQGTDAQGRLDASVLAIACLGHAQVQGEVHAFLFHDSHQQADRPHHDDRVRGLDGDDHVGEMLVYADAQELHARFYHALGRITIAR